MDTTLDKFINNTLDWLKDFLPNLLGAIIILVLGMWLSGIIAKIVSKALKSAKIGETVISFVNSFVKISIKVLVIVAALGTLGFNVASLVTAVGAATVAIGLALQDSLKNVASGITILIAKPFTVGDYLETNGLQGTVTRIDIASTHLLTIDNKEVIIPNSSISTSNIVNYTSQDKRGVFLSYHVSYNTDIDLVKNVIMGVINKNKTIFKEPVPFIVVGKHEENGMEIIVRVWCKTSDYWNVYFYMQENIKKSFDDNNIEIPFTQIDVHNIPQIERNEKITKQSDKKKT